MRFKLIIAMVEDERSDAVLEAARGAGATGATILSQARGEGMTAKKTFFGVRHQVQQLQRKIEGDL